MLRIVIGLYPSSTCDLSWIFSLLDISVMSASWCEKMSTSWGIWMFRPVLARCPLPLERLMAHRIGFWYRENDDWTSDLSRWLSHCEEFLDSVPVSNRNMKVTIHSSQQEQWENLRQFKHFYEIQKTPLPWTTISHVRVMSISINIESRFLLLSLHVQNFGFPHQRDVEEEYDDIYTLYDKWRAGEGVKDYYINDRFRRNEKTLFIFSGRKSWPGHTTCWGVFFNVKHR